MRLLFCFVVRIFLEIFEMCESHSWAWTWRAIAIFCWSRELIVGESVWWFLCEGDELGDFYQGFDVECAYSAYDYWYDFDICF